MGFLGIGTWEILLILILALIIMGPGKLTEFARTLGKTLRTIKKASSSLTTIVTKELEAEKYKPLPSQQKEENRVETGEASSAISKTTVPSQRDQPIKPEEASDIKTALEMYETRLKAVSFLRYEETGYIQAPYEPITREQYQEMSKNITPVQRFSTDEAGEGTKFCDGDSCTF